MIAARVPATNPMLVGRCLTVWVKVNDVYLVPSATCANPLHINIADDAQDRWRHILWKCEYKLHRSVDRLVMNGQVLDFESFLDQPVGWLSAPYHLVAHIDITTDSTSSSDSDSPNTRRGHRRGARRELRNRFDRQGYVFAQPLAGNPVQYTPIDLTGNTDGLHYHPQRRQGGPARGDRSRSRDE